MSELPIPQEAVEAAARAVWEQKFSTPAWDELSGAVREEMRVSERAALRAGLETMGLEVQLRASGDPQQPRKPARYWRRYISRWLPVEQDS